MKSRLMLALPVFLLATSIASAAGYKVEVLKEKAPADELSPAVFKTLAATGMRVSDDQGKPFCDVWLAEPWSVDAAFKPTNDHLYPFAAGQLIGAVRFATKTNDFRDQPLKKGVYTLRYALQPQDGNHVGTSDTRDFLVMILAKDDPDPAALAQESLFKKAAAAAGSAHPAMLALKRGGDKPESLPALRHDEDHELWILQFSGVSKAADKEAGLLLEVVVVGHASE